MGAALESILFQPHLLDFDLCLSGQLSLFSVPPQTIIDRSGKTAMIMHDHTLSRGSTDRAIKSITASGIEPIEWEVVANSGIQSRIQRE